MKNRESKYESKTVEIRRVAKVTSGGKRLRFSAMVVAGDRNGTVGVGLGRGVDTRSAIEKATRQAEKAARKIQLIGDTIPHEIKHKSGAAEVLLRPARPGTGVIAGSSVRTVLELCGIDNVYGKMLGSNNIIMNTYCTFEALQVLRSGRVLEKMHKMKDRLHLKEQLDAERKKRESLIRKKSEDSKKKGKNDRKDKKYRSFKTKRYTDHKTEVTPAPTVKQPDIKEQEVKNVETTQVEVKPKE